MSAPNCIVNSQEGSTETSTLGAQLVRLEDLQDLGTYVYTLPIIGQLVNDYFPKQNRVVLQ